MTHQFFTMKPHYSSSIPHYLLLLTIYEPMIHQLLSTVVHPFLTLNPPLFTNCSPMIQPLFINYSSSVIPPLFANSINPKKKSPLMPMNYNSPILGRSLIKSGTKFSQKNIHHADHSPILEFTN